MARRPNNAELVNGGTETNKQDRSKWKMELPGMLTDYGQVRLVD